MDANRLKWEAHMKRVQIIEYGQKKKHIKLGN